MKFSFCKYGSGKQKFYAFPNSIAGSYLILKDGSISVFIRDMASFEEMREFCDQLIQSKVIIFDELNNKFSLNNNHPLVLIERFKNYLQNPLSV